MGLRTLKYKATMVAKPWETANINNVMEENMRLTSQQSNSRNYLTHKSCPKNISYKLQISFKFFQGIYPYLSKKMKSPSTATRWKAKMTATVCTAKTTVRNHQSTHSLPNAHPTTNTSGHMPPTLVRNPPLKHLNKHKANNPNTNLHSNTKPLSNQPRRIPNYLPQHHSNPRTNKLERSQDHITGSRRKRAGAEQTQS